MPTIPTPCIPQLKMIPAIVMMQVTPVIARSLVVFDVKKDLKSRIESESARASCLDTETGLAPMSSLGVVPVVVLTIARIL